MFLELLTIKRFYKKYFYDIKCIIKLFIYIHSMYPFELLYLKLLIISFI